MTASSIQLLLPPLRYWPKPLPDRIARALGRADRTDTFNDSIIDLPASAALSRLGEGDLDIDSVRAYRWLRADPAWIRPDITGARLYAVGAMLPLSADDAASFSPALQGLLDDAGYQLDIVTPHRWYLRMPVDAVLPNFATPVTALGEDPFEHRPEGEGAREWRGLDNEVQITLHQHPRNAQRLSTGLPPINAIWWWGDAALPDKPSSQIPSIYSDDPLLRGWAKAANLHSNPVPERWSMNVDGLYDLRAVPRDALFDRWLEPALDDVKKGTAMQWICEEGPCFLLTARQRWRFWRSPVDFSVGASESEE